MDPISLLALGAFVAKNATSWLAVLRGTLLDTGKDMAVGKAKELAVAKSDGFAHRLFRLDEKEQLRHLAQALKNATERGLAPFDTLQERDQYKDILYTLSQPGPTGEALRREVLQLFTLAQTPDLATLSDLYNQRKRYYDSAHQDCNAGPYLTSFFSALVGELYADPYFRPQLSDALELRNAQSMERSLLDIFAVLKKMGETLTQEYSIEEFERDKDLYTAHLGRTLHNLKIVGVVPKDQNSDPELSGIFVPLRIAVHEQISRSDQQASDIIQALEQTPCMILLGGPGSGKSTATKYLAWSHAIAHQSQLAHSSLLSGDPLPLRIELRRLNEERRRDNYDFLSFVTEVLLKREGIEINPQMFKELLARRAMLLLFDGLDEVTTIDERLGLVNEIEHFAIQYPGNRVLVTSRPVGYELAPVSHPLFQRATILDLDDEQIELFLNNWYTAVLKLSPIPQQEQEELNLLLETIEGNERLRKLAENPLLLTVITALHRYTRLPDRRVLVYEECAKLLLEKWAKLRGTHARWKDMKMVQEDQYACVAHLGFVLHERSQEDADDDGKREETVDVSARFLYSNVEAFLKKQKLIAGVAEQRTEARRFIDLVREEAGLIVERGTDENGEPLYSFVHRTFQEYFAAADVYEQYLQRTDLKVISKFLKAHLHDPHWREVILLLLAKLKSMPVTNILRQILQGKIRSDRSRYTEIVQQDLFFVCDCLLEEMKVESTLVEMVVVRLSEVVKNAWFPSQRREALEYLGKLAQTRQYVGQGLKELVTFVTKENVLDIMGKLNAAQALYLYNTTDSKERELAEQTLITLLGQSDFPTEQVVQEYDNIRFLESKERQFAVSILTSLLARSDLSPEQASRVAYSLYLNSADESEVHQLATSTLTSLLAHPDLSPGQISQIARFLYLSGSDRSEAQQFATSKLTSLLARPDLSPEQASQVALSLYRLHDGSEAEMLATTTLASLLARPDLPLEQTRLIAESLYQNSPADSETELLAITTLASLLARPNLSPEQTLRVAESLSYNSFGPEPYLLVISTLTSLLARPDLSPEQRWLATEFLFNNVSIRSEEDLFAISMLLTLLSQTDTSLYRTDVYFMLSDMVPYFHKLPPTTLPGSNPQLSQQ